MPKRKIFLLLAAAAIAVVTVVVARSMMTANPQSVSVETPAEPASEVLAAARDLPIGTLIKDADLKWVPWPAEAQNTNLFVKGTADKPTLVGSLLRQSVRADMPILANQVVNSHARGFLAAVLQP